MDEETFNRLTDPANKFQLHELEAEDIDHGKCPDCDIPFENNGNEYECGFCGLTMVRERDYGKNLDNTASSVIRVTTGANRGRIRNVNSDYSATQKKNLLQQLMKNQADYTGPKFSHDILDAVATQYNVNQKTIIEKFVNIDGSAGSKKFVRRGNIKDEILAALINFECIRVDNIRKRKDIAEFMKLPNDGFARGEDIIRTLEAQGLINLTISAEPIKGFIERYLEALGMDDKDNALKKGTTPNNYEKFVTEIVEKSEEVKLGMESQISSKIVGAIWIIITRTKLKISAPTLEKATDNTKKNTFMKFCNIVYANMPIFAEIFHKYNIPCQ